MNGSLRFAVAGALVVSTLALSGCFPLAVTGAAVGTLAAMDRRTIGAQTEDQEIELRARGQLSQAIGQSSGISVTSYNRKVLLSGQVAAAQDKTRAEEIVAALPNVRSVHNE
ncbi:MAG TPA: BON domain-containing protein, partial [Burkholderiaceae bacterium]|nr:BON domain-containing protein [Burkholderiaceae bacterium]